MTDSERAVSVSSEHPHEPGDAPVYDAEGRCLVCAVELRDEQLARLRDRERQAREYAGALIKMKGNATLPHYQDNAEEIGKYLLRLLDGRDAA